MIPKAGLGGSAAEWVAFLHSVGSFYKTDFPLYFESALTRKDRKSVV